MSEIKSTFDSRLPLEVKEKLKSSKVAVAGLGGLGSNIAVMLARSGVGKLLLIDFDKVDISNLNRQAYSIPHLGMRKTDALTEIIKDINPSVELETICTKVTKENATSLLGDYPIMCEAFDKAEQKAMLISTILSECKNTIIVSGNGMAGYSDSNKIQTKKVMDRLYVCGDGVSDIEKGDILIASRVLTCAGHQATKVIQLILEQQPTVND